MKRKSLILSVTCIALTGALTVAASNAYAGWTYESFDLVAPKHNGDVWSTPQTKSATDHDGDLSVASVGGNYKLDARMSYPNTTLDIGTFGWVRVDDNTQHKLWNWVQSGSRVSVQFSNDLFTPVNVRVKGTWRSR